MLLAEEEKGDKVCQRLQQHDSGLDPLPVRTDKPLYGRIFNYLGGGTDLAAAELCPESRHGTKFALWGAI